MCKHVRAGQIKGQLKAQILKKYAAVHGITESGNGASSKALARLKHPHLQEQFAQHIMFNY
ncbi:hypothetical protein BDA96_10G151800 [Sorghum bicolor]|uniref:Uncharacterized protein n=2 Tax=Sorghum bicolor TaxID=4558 RepID=A0A921Q255_SORBI|nr:hypothetical protein BDA96_10G151800 [Sorghum bicolor]KXG19832.1 hypothetical protein SORBI_3010G123000 [Sorghum bicolor]